MSKRLLFSGPLVVAVFVVSAFSQEPDSPPTAEPMEKTVRSVTLQSASALPSVLRRELARGIEGNREPAIQPLVDHVQQKVLAAYAANGFPHARVTVKALPTFYDPDCEVDVLVNVIEEGPKEAAADPTPALMAQNAATPEAAEPAAQADAPPTVAEAVTEAAEPVSRVVPASSKATAKPGAIRPRTITVDSIILRHPAEVRWSGVTAFSQQRLTDQFLLRLGSTLDRARLEAAIASIRQIYESHGYLNFVALPRIQMDESDGSITVSIDVMEGGVFHLKKFEVVGADNETSTKLKAAWPMRAGEVFRDDIAQKFLTSNSGLVPQHELSDKVCQSVDLTDHTVEYLLDFRSDSCTPEGTPGGEKGLTISHR